VYEASSCTKMQEVIDFFGYGRLAKLIYAEAGIEAAEQVD
jgi:hypothetical protein